ncbi:MAG: penicillin-binding protein 2 [Alphaproteobacteria bacterium]|nr:penicillin-binding protein 2 [Alphaproteobacteria bacterium]
MMFNPSARDAFYPVGAEIPKQKKDAYRCVDAATRRRLQQSKSRLLIVAACACAAFAGIVVRLFFLTVVDYQPRQFKPSVLRTEYYLKRQKILDRNGTEIAMSVPTTDLGINPQLVKNPEEAARNLARILTGVSADEVMRKIGAGGSFQYVKRNVTPHERNDVNWLGYYFLSEANGEKRIYPQGASFSHVLGGVDIDSNGIAGLEKSLGQVLQASDVALSLDATVQEMVRTTLAQSVEKFSAEGGLAVVMDVHTGEVLASVSLPDYDPNMPADGAPDKRFNKATLGSYEFGSVFKLFNTALGLESGAVKPWETIDASEPFKIGRKLIDDYQGQYRPLTVPEILMHSSNIGSVRIAQRVGYQKQRAFLKTLGFYQKLPVNLPERGGTQHPSTQKWADITSANVAFGYGVSITPLHLIAGVAALVNGGYYNVPTFVRDGNAGRPAYRVVSEKTSDALRQMMWAVVNWEMKETDPVAPYAVGGKTGSANLIDPATRKYIKGALRTTFVCAFPMDKPQYAVLVVLENPKRLKETWGFNTAGWNAKPAGLAIVAQIAPYLGVTPQPAFPQADYIARAIASSAAHKKKR